jgi:hypothetical protein
MDETRHGGDEVNKEDETVMDDAQGSSTDTSLATCADRLHG